MTSKWSLPSEETMSSGDGMVSSNGFVNFLVGSVEAQALGCERVVNGGAMR